MGIRHLTCITVLACLCCLSVSCTKSKDYYEEYRQLPGESWDMDKPLTFAFDITDTAIPYRLNLNFRYTDAFPWQDIFLFLQSTLPDGSLSRDTLHCPLFEPDGRPMGNGHRVKELEVAYSLLRFPMPGHYTLHFSQGMRAKKVNGIISFGISLKKTGSENISSKP